MFIDYEDPEKDPGEEREIGRDPKTGKAWTVWVRAAPEAFVKTINLEFGIQGKRTFADLSTERREAYSLKFAKFVLVEVGEMFAITPGDTGSAAAWSKLLGEEVPVGEPVLLRGMMSKPGVKERIFTTGVEGPRLVGKVVQLSADIAARAVKLEREAEGNS